MLEYGAFIYNVKIHNFELNVGEQIDSLYGPWYRSKDGEIFLNNSKEKCTKFQLKCIALIALNSRILSILKLRYIWMKGILLNEEINVSSLSIRCVEEFGHITEGDKLAELS